MLWSGVEGPGLQLGGGFVKRALMAKMDPRGSHRPSESHPGDGNSYREPRTGGHRG